MPNLFNLTKNTLLAITVFFLYLIIIQDVSFAAERHELRGFGTAAAEKSTEAQYLSDYGTEGDQLNVSRFTRIGLNLYSEISPEWSVSAQMIARKVDEAFQVRMEWGFLSWMPLQEFSIRAGRLVAPVWLYSQQINAGYSYLWITPPTEVYNLNPLSAVNGVSLLGKLPLSDGLIQAEIVAGEASQTTQSRDPENPQNSDIRIKHLLALELSYNWKEIIQIRAGAARANVSATVHAQLPIPAGAIPGFPGGTHLDISTPLDLERFQFYSLGAKVDYSNIIFITEFSRRLLSGQDLTRAYGYYSTLGYRIRSLTPHLAYAKQGDLQGNYWLHPDFPRVITRTIGSETWSLGLNYMANESIVIKAEYSRAQIKYDNSIHDLDFAIYRAAVDFVF